MKSFNIYLLISFLIIFNSCIPNDLDFKEPETGEVTEDPIQGLGDLSIPNGFNFETERAVTLTINDETPFVKYEVFAYSTNYISEAENIGFEIAGKFSKSIQKNHFNLGLNYAYTSAKNLEKNKTILPKLS